MIVTIGGLLTRCSSLSSNLILSKKLSSLIWSSFLKSYPNSKQSSPICLSSNNVFKLQVIPFK
ncbi:MAG: hypothetical protein K2J69_01645, partial [Malacoplasma sp.]|nr:hypothetical protein [Malacoplasma sp.]